MSIIYKNLDNNMIIKIKFSKITYPQKTPVCKK